MRATGYLTLALLAAATLGSAPAYANMCKTDNLSCATGMPLDGYCECTARGNTEGGTVVSGGVVMKKQTKGATAAGCGAHPNDPGCR